VIGPPATSYALPLMTAGLQRTPPDGVDYTRKWLVLFAVAMAIFLGTVDGSIVNVALPTLVDEFDTSFGVVQWVVLAYNLTQATLVLGIGRLGDMIGKKMIFTAGFAVFTVGSMLAGLSPNVAALIGFRVLQAVGAAMIFALGFAITAEAFPPSERGKALGINGTMVSLGIITGPIIGGLILEAADWRWIFYVNLPIGIIGTITAWRFVPHTRPGGGRRFDFLGAFLFLISLLSLLLGLTWGQTRGFTDSIILILFAIAIATMAAFISVERRVAEPMVDLEIFSNPDVTVNLITGFISFVALSGMLVLLPFYLSDVLGYGPRSVGLLLGAVPVSLGIVAPFSGSLSDRIGWRPVTVTGLAILTAGFTFAAFALTTQTTAIVFIAVGLVIGVGMGVFQSPNNSAILGAVPSHRLGITSGMLTINRLTGFIAGVAVIGTIWATRTVSYAGGGTADDAPAAAQASGLSDTLTLTAALVACALVLGVWMWRRDTQAGT
jgi:EmrB/QacA subfamily drug resistance transporter